MMRCSKDRYSNWQSAATTASRCGRIDTGRVAAARGGCSRADSRRSGMRARRWIGRSTVCGGSGESRRARRCVPGPA